MICLKKMFKTNKFNFIEKVFKNKSKIEVPEIKENYYELLNVDKNATKEEIKRNYLKLG